MTEPNRRQFQRIPFRAEVTLTQAEAHWHGRLLDISLKGLLLQGPLPAEVDRAAPVDVQIALSEQQSINMQTQVVHSEAQHTGLKCTSIDMASIAHLRRLIELNIGAEAAERELHELF